MGTTKSGRYLNTNGSANSASDFAVVHSDEGAFTRAQMKINGKKVQKLRLNNGGHGQNGMDLLQKYGIDFNIVKTYPNGVRVGNIPSHKNRQKRAGTNQSWFPETWTPSNIRQAGEHVASLRKNQSVPDGQPFFGSYKGVRVGVIRTHGKIGTIFPDSNQNAE